jgi:hypothetical protein
MVEHEKDNDKMVEHEKDNDKIVEHEKDNDKMVEHEKDNDKRDEIDGTSNAKMDTSTQSPSTRPPLDAPDFIDIQRALESGVIAYPTLRHVSLTLSAHKSASTSHQLHHLLQSSHFIWPRPPQRQRSHSLQRRLDAIRAKWEQKDYDRMVSCSSGTSSLLLQDFGSDWRELRTQMAMVVNILFSAIGVFVSAMYFGHYLTPDMGMVCLFFDGDYYSFIQANGFIIFCSFIQSLFFVHSCKHILSLFLVHSCKHIWSLFLAHSYKQI